MSWLCVTTGLLKLMSFFWQKMVLHAKLNKTSSHFKLKNKRKRRKLEPNQAINHKTPPSEYNSESLKRAVTNFRQAHPEFHSPCLLVSDQYWSLRISRKHTCNNFCLLECIKQRCWQQGMVKVVGALLLYLQTFNIVGWKFSLFHGS